MWTNFVFFFCTHARHGTLTAELQRIQNTEMRCCWIILRIAYTDHVTNVMRSWLRWRDGCWSSANMSPDHPAWLRPSCKALWRQRGEGEDKGIGGKTASESGQDWSLCHGHRGLCKTDRDGSIWLWGHWWCPYNPLGQGTDRLRGKRFHTALALRSLPVTVWFHDYHDWIW